MHERWLDERHHEHYYKLAKKLDYRSRASFKIMQIDDRFNIFKEGDSVVDLGAAPGGWLQVAKERVGESGKVIGVDLRPIKPMEGVTTILGDITDDNTMLKLLESFGGKRTSFCRTWPQHSRRVRHGSCKIRTSLHVRSRCM